MKASEEASRKYCKKYYGNDLLSNGFDIQMLEEYNKIYQQRMWQQNYQNRPMYFAGIDYGIDSK